MVHIKKIFRIKKKKKEPEKDLSWPLQAQPEFWYMEKKETWVQQGRGATAKALKRELPRTPVENQNPQTLDKRLWGLALTALWGHNHSKD